MKFDFGMDENEADENEDAVKDQIVDPKQDLANNIDFYIKEAVFVNGLSLSDTLGIVHSVLFQNLMDCYTISQVAKTNIACEENVNRGML